jgi:hypothetical protein
MPSTAELQEEINRLQRALTQSENRAEMYFQQLVMGIHVRSDLKPFFDQVERNKGRSAERESGVSPSVLKKARSRMIWETSLLIASEH